MLILLASGKLRKLSGRDHLFCLLQGGCVFCFNFWCFYSAAAWINTGLESVIFSMAVLFNAVNSFVFFGHKPPLRFYYAAGLGLTGIITLFWQDSGQQRLEPLAVTGDWSERTGNVWLLFGQYDQHAPSEKKVWKS
ncbi:inner membrane protein [Citrobacter koseri]|nr:inner membrane protein [Citrobacter koseri]